MIVDNSGNAAKGRFRALDGLRGAAALLVVVYHIAFYSIQWPNHLFDNDFVRHGYLAVDLFFILSGLVISSNYSLRLNNLSEVKEFLLLRFFRLYPLHAFVLGGLVLLELVKLVVQSFSLMAPSEYPPFTGYNTIEGLVANLLLVNGWHVSKIASWNGPSWSISCEWAAYLVYSVVILAGLAKRRLFFITGVLMTIFIYPLFIWESGTLDFTADWGIIRGLSGFFLGMLIFQLDRGGSFRLPSRVAAIFEILAAAALIPAITFARGTLILVVIPLFVLLVALLRSDQGPVAFLLNSRSAQFLGRISYSIYMVHSIIVTGFVIAVKHVVPYFSHSSAINSWTGDILAILALICVVTTSAVTYAFIEEPARLVGRRHFTRYAKRIDPATRCTDASGKPRALAVNTRPLHQFY